MYADFNDWLRANGFDPETVTAAQKTKLQATWRAESNPPPSPPPPPPVDTPKAVESGGFEAEMQAIERENERIETIRKMTVQACSTSFGNPQKVQQLRAMCDAAIADDKTSVKDFQLALLRAGRYDAALVVSSGTPQATDEVIEAAVCKAGGLETLEEEFDERTLSAVDKHFPGGLGLQDLIGHFARKGGFRGHSIKAALNTPEVLRCAFRAEPDGGHQLMAGVAGPSTYSLPTIFSAVSNKFLRVGFMAVDSAWREIAATRSVSDFKAITTAALTGSFIFKQLAPGGEIQHGDLAERTYTNQAQTQARMFGIDRRDLINDDLGALTSVSRRLGRGGALRLNEMFWTAFLANTSFFAAGNNNVITGASSVLSGATGPEALRLADQKFLDQTDPDGLPLAVKPAILLVPNALRIPALTLMTSTTMAGSTTANSLMPTTNPFAGAFRVVSSPYLSNSAFTGNSSTAWYLLASPDDMPVIEVVFLNGKQTPTVETTDADFNTLGIAMRGYFDAGVALQEFRGGVRAAGA